MAFSSVALFASLGGVSEAAKAISGKQIKNSSVTGVKIKNGSIGSTDLARNSVRGSNANASGTRTLNFPTLAKGDCTFVEVNGVSSKTGDIGDNAVLLSPDGTVDSTGSFAFYATPNGANQITVAGCNVGGDGPLDPDGPGGLQYRFVSFSL